MSKNNKKIDFGFKSVDIDEKQRLVKQVFDNVYDNYNFMNDLMSFGLHRFWKNELINWLAPQKHQYLADLAGGTGDVAKKFLKAGGNKADIIDINRNMIMQGKENNNNNLRYIIGNCENIPTKSCTYDRITMSFGLRNITYREKALNEVFRVLKPGGRFICLEFSKIEDAIFQKYYDIWSFKFIPLLGKFFTNNSEAYTYLAESIRKFPNQDELAQIMTNCKFSRISYKSLTNGVVALHSGWKI